MRISAPRTSAKAIIGSLMLSMPFQGCAPQRAVTHAVAKPPIVAAKIDSSYLPVFQPKSPLVAGLPRTCTPNLNGNKVEEYEQNELRVLSRKILDKTSKIEFVSPINKAYKPYIPKIGIFGAPSGYGKILPNLGVDIYVKGDSTSKSIPVLAPTNGIVVGQSLPIKRFGMQKTNIMGKDGIVYSLSFPTSREDIKKAKLPLAPQIGGIAKVNDTLGFVSDFLNKGVFPIHLKVEDPNLAMLQRDNATWQELSRYFSDHVQIRGQIDPLKAKGISGVLKSYRLEPGAKVLPITKQLEDI